MNTISWNSKLLKFKNPHILQTTEWGSLKSYVGWESIIFQNPIGSNDPNALSLILQRQVAKRGIGQYIKVLYTPKGPIIDWNNSPLRSEIFKQLENVARNRNAIFIKIDPDVETGYGLPNDETDEINQTGVDIISELQERNWLQSPEQIQFRNTIHIDLTPDEDEILAKMKQKTRYNIRLAARKGITIRLGTISDLDLLYKYYAETSIRDGFVIREQVYYIRAWEKFIKANMADILLAEYKGTIVAGLILYRFGPKSWYMYGMSRNLHREKMPTYLLQWEAIRRSKAMGCTIYDLWGAPDQFDETDPMWGVYRFKEGFGGKVVRTIGAWDYPVNKLIYRLYTTILPKFLGLMRSRGKTQTQKILIE